MVFQLNSDVTGRKSFGKISRNVHLYELDSVQLVVTNPFSVPGNFELKFLVSSKDCSPEGSSFLDKKGEEYSWQLCVVNCVLCVCVVC